MKKLICLIVCTAVLLSATGCGQGAIKKGEKSSVVEGEIFDVTMEVVPESVRPGSITICVKNNTDIEIHSGNENDFAIEVLDNGKWYTIDVGSRENTAEAYIFEDERDLDISWSNTYGALPNGHYRIVKYFFPWTEDGTYGIKDGFYLTAEFDIE